MWEKISWETVSKLRQWKSDLTWWILKRLSARIKYWCTMSLISEVTTGEFSDTIVPELTAMDAVKRFADKHKI